MLYKVQLEWECNFLKFFLSKVLAWTLVQIQANILWLLQYSGNSIGFLFSFVQSSNCLPWCTSLFMLVWLNILLHTYPHAALLTILDAVRVLPISSMYQNFNLKFISLLSSLASVLPLMLQLFGIHFLKTFAHHPLLPLLERSSKPISTQRHIFLSSFSLMAYGGNNCGTSRTFIVHLIAPCNIHTVSHIQTRPKGVLVYKCKLQSHQRHE